MFLTEDEDNTCRDMGESCRSPFDECCSGLECGYFRYIGDFRCCKSKGASCIASDICCDGYCDRFSGKCEVGPDGGDVDVDVKQMDSFKGLDASNDQSMKAVFLTEDEDSTCLEIGEECGPQAPYPNNFMQCCVGHCLSNTRKCCTMGECSSDSDCCANSDWSGICGSNGLCTQR